jgi:hypothetical protein
MPMSPLGMQLMLAQAWLQMGMPQPNVFMNYLQQAMMNSGYGPGINQFLGQQSTGYGYGSQPPVTDYACVSVDMAGNVNAQGSDGKAVLRQLLRTREHILERHGADDPRVAALDGAIHDMRERLASRSNGGATSTPTPSTSSSSDPWAGCAATPAPATPRDPWADCAPASTPAPAKTTTADPWAGGDGVKPQPRVIKDVDLRNVQTELV